MDTIFALASGSGRGGIAVTRLSGPKTAAALLTLCGRETLPEPRKAVRIRPRDPDSGEILDDGLVLWFPAPHSFTGEDVAELHLHGGRAVAQAITAALRRLGLRPAEPGEFSKRAFIAGKIDLTQAEAIADLVAAETAAQRRQALRQMDGALVRLYDDWRARLLQAQAHFEVEIDFSDEDIPDGVAAAARHRMAALLAEMQAHLADNQRGERLRDGWQIAILGAPNVGKSSLLNRLAGREAAIVSAQAGTTRDIIEVHLDLGGYPVLLADTAGLREADACAIEAEGIRRARRRAGQADLKLVVFDATQSGDWDRETLRLLDEDGGEGQSGDSLVLLNKTDAISAPLPAVIAGHPVIAVSAKTGDGLDQLLATLSDRAAQALESQGMATMTRARHRAAVEDAAQALRRAMQVMLPELAAEDVRVALQALGRITGRVDVEEMLDIIFRDFCIGK